ncbi:hypothetical protein EDB81DRAFT_902793 [Dactylonectria macrodidyma]|uniref:Hypervirulence associated protein TUDOR domain-containing protein n=1 Tax=Dactylonectria macrodidyma TaxID=307937 RepID=A0A9P9IUK1_9HYPO|nr:hypothetical protein EDB81DRAFT_902793 [Dactylonectria macrodidyma]
MPSEVKDKKSQTIHKGDEVWTPFRGGKRQGEVDRVVMNENEAKEADVKNPPKVLFADQHGHNVAHNPGTLENVSKE